MLQVCLTFIGLDSKGSVFDVKRKVFRSSKMMLDLDKKKNLDLLQMSLPILYECTYCNRNNI